MSHRAAVLLPTVAAAGFLAVGLFFGLLGYPAWRTGSWTAGLYLVGLPLVFRTARGIARGRFAADLVASLAIIVAIVLGHALPGLVVALMQTGGEALEHHAAARATRVLHELEAKAPRIAHRRTTHGWEDLPAEAVQVGDVLLVRPGEMIPCDGAVIAGEAAIDVSRLTGEPVPLAGRPGVLVRSGALVLDRPLTIRATAPARESLYAKIVDLVRSAQASKAPLQRVADRAAVWFTPATLGVCAVAWSLSGDPDRVLAVLVVATPCPLILATPVAVIGGISRAARHGIIIRHGGALEALASLDAAVFDKTGTLTLGRPEVERIDAVAPFQAMEVLGLAAAVERGAGHPLARSVERAAEAAALSIPAATGVVEAPGRGVTGQVGEKRVTIGAFSLLRELEPDAARGLERHRNGRLTAYVAIQGEPAAIVRFADRPRPGIRETLDQLRELGLSRQMLLSGDRSEVVASTALAIGIAEAQGDLLPGDKVDAVRRLQARGHRVLMIGDGINDAPALSAATVGVALASHGGGIAAESADVVILEDDPSRLVDTVAIGRTTMRIAYQSLIVGLGLSLVGMTVAALGYLPPTPGALLQEGIDLAVIANALRAARHPSRLPREEDGF